MRWERMFAEIDNQHHEACADERDSLAEDLVAENWRDTSWLDLLTGTVELEVRGVGPMRGEVAAVAELIELRASGRQSWIEPSRVLSAAIDGHRRSTPTNRTWRVQLGAAFSSRVRVWLCSGTSLDGLLVNVGGDFVQLAAGANRREIVIPRAGLSAVSMLESRR